MLLRLVILFVLGYLAYSFVKGLKAGASRMQGGTGSTGAKGTGVGGAGAGGTSQHEDMVHDEVCDTYIPVNSAIVVESGGKTLYFCSETCKEKYTD